MDKDPHHHKLYELIKLCISQNPRHKFLFHSKWNINEKYLIKKQTTVRSPTNPYNWSKILRYCSVSNQNQKSHLLCHCPHIGPATLQRISKGNIHRPKKNQIYKINDCLDKTNTFRISILVNSFALSLSNLSIWINLSVYRLTMSWNISYLQKHTIRNW